MLATYQRLTTEGKIGPFDAEGRPRPWQEYPKLVTIHDAEGKAIEKIVNSQREELALRAESVPGVKLEDDPVLAEKNRLAQEVIELRAKLAALSGSQTSNEPAPLQGIPAKPPVASPKAPTTEQKNG